MRKDQVEFAAEWGRQWGVDVATEAVCRGHSAPGEFLAQWMFARPSLSLVHGPRGGGKSFLRSLATHYDSLRHPRHETHVLGGSLAQSKQIYGALGAFHAAAPDAGVFRRLLKTEAEYATASKVSILAASPTSVRGPHVASLCLDEVDEIDPEIREDSFGMCMEMHGVRASVSMTSTWHRPGGPMAELMERGKAGGFPVHSFCVFEVLERCPPERSGRLLERCPSCPIQPWCHSEFAPGPDGTPQPKAKRSDGHYAIDALIQKVRAVSPRVFESDYLCSRPKAAGVWFTEFDEAGNVAGDAEAFAADYVPGHPVHASIDVGVWAGAVLFQVFRGEPRPGGGPAPVRVNVFAEHLSHDVPSDQVARNVRRLIAERCGDAASGGGLAVSVDSAAGAKNPVGKTIEAIFRDEGLVGSDGRLRHWPRYAGSVGDTLALLERLVLSADGYRALVIHPRCRRLIAAMHGYRRKFLRGEATDQPVDPQHPAEEMVDALRGGLAIEFPTRLEPEPELGRVDAARML